MDSVRSRAPRRLIQGPWLKASVVWWPRAAFSHSAPVVAPGATLIFLGGAWTGSALARQGVRLFRAAGGDDRNPGDTGD